MSASESEEIKCEVCGTDLRDPKRRGDPDENGDWVCSAPSCRQLHDVAITCDIIRETAQEGDAQ